jgi:two-component sensor histidine kinase
VLVGLRRDGDIVVTVEDDGAGCDEAAIEGLGTRLVRLMTQQLHGTLTREPAPSGCKVALRLQA